MDERNLKRLEFGLVKEKLAGNAGSQISRELIMDLKPFKNKDDVTDALAEVTEGRELLRLEPSARLGGWNDIREEVRRCERGGVLEAEQLWRVLQTLAAGRQIKKFFGERRERYVRLSEVALGLADFNTLEKRISVAVLPGGDIADRASERLYNLRKRFTSAQQRVKERLDAIIRSTSYQKYLQDPIVTIREGRYVVPVKQEYRGQVPGIVHDQSASGATLFIEPMTVVEANNEVRSLLIEEKQEVERILQELSAGVGERSGELQYALENLGRIDFIMAKARYSEQLNAWEPVIIQEAKLNIKRGRHPLLLEKAVPISVKLGQDFDSLIITGPNTGGKTVTLKTVGLLVIMAQSGLHVPADEGTYIGMFDDVFVDIGDEQSIEQSLSTFSSHMTNIVHILSKADNRSLVLLDELGAGTDPVEGSALAQAILDQLRYQGTKTIATTHYGELKNYAYASERVENASVEFDPITLSPTYKLLIGRPGRSNAFEIAGRLGLGDMVIARAKSFLSEEQIKVAEIMRELEMARQQAEKDRVEAQKALKEADEYKERYLFQLEKINSRKEEIIAGAVAETREMVKKTRREVEAIIEELRLQMKEDSARNREAGIVATRQRLKQINEQVDGLAKDEIPERGNQKLEKVTPGDEVFISKYGQAGVVLDVWGNEDNAQVQVQVGVLRITLDKNELSPVRQKKKDQPKAGLGQLVQQKARNISTRLDLRGMRVDEALAELDKYLDDACIAGLPQIYLVHGKGTGALRSAVQQVLKQHHRVKYFRLGEQGEGGSGVTVVQLS